MNTEPLGNDNLENTPDGNPSNSMDGRTPNDSGHELPVDGATDSLSNDGDLQGVTQDHPDEAQAPRQENDLSNSVFSQGNLDLDSPKETTLPSLENLDFDSKIFKSSRVITLLAFLSDLSVFGVEDDHKIFSSDLIQRFPSIGSETTVNKTIRDLIDLNLLERQKTSGIRITELGLQLCSLPQFNSKISRRRTKLVNDLEKTFTSPELAQVMIKLKGKNQVQACLTACFDAAEADVRNQCRDNRLALRMGMKPPKVRPLVAELQRLGLLDPLRKLTPLAMQWREHVQSKKTKKTKSKGKTRKTKQKQSPADQKRQKNPNKPSQKLRKSGTDAPSKSQTIEDGVAQKPTPQPTPMQEPTSTEQATEGQKADNPLVNQASSSPGEIAASPQVRQGEEPQEAPSTTYSNTVILQAKRYNEFATEFSHSDLRAVDRKKIQAMRSIDALAHFEGAKQAYQLQQAFRLSGITKDLSDSQISFTDNGLQITIDGPHLRFRELFNFLDENSDKLGRDHNLIVASTSTTPDSELQHQVLDLLFDNALGLQRTESRIRQALLKFVDDVETAANHSKYLNGTSFEKQLKIIRSSFFSSAISNSGISEDEIPRFASRPDESSTTRLAQLLELTMGTEPLVVTQAIQAFVMSEGNRETANDLLPAIHSLSPTLRMFGLKLNQLEVLDDSLRSSSQVRFTLNGGDAIEPGAETLFASVENPSLLLGLSRKAHSDFCQVDKIHISPVSTSENLTDILRSMYLNHYSQISEMTEQAQALPSSLGMPVGTDLVSSAKDIKTLSNNVWITDGLIGQNFHLVDATFKIDLRRKPCSALLEVASIYTNQGTVDSDKLNSALRSVVDYNIELIVDEAITRSNYQLQIKDGAKEVTSIDIDRFPLDKIDDSRIEWIENLLADQHSGHLLPSFVAPLADFPIPVMGEPILNTAKQLTQIETHLKEFAKVSNLTLRNITLNGAGIRFQLEGDPSKLRDLIQYGQADESKVASQEIGIDRSLTPSLVQLLSEGIEKELGSASRVEKLVKQYSNVGKLAWLDRIGDELEARSKDKILLQEFPESEYSPELRSLLKILSARDIKAATILNRSGMAATREEILKLSEVINCVEKCGYPSSLIRLTDLDSKANLAKRRSNVYSNSQELYVETDPGRQIYVDKLSKVTKAKDVDWNTVSYAIETKWSLESAWLSPIIERIYITKDVDLAELRATLLRFRAKPLELFDTFKESYIDTLWGSDPKIINHRAPMQFSEGDKTSSHFIGFESNKLPFWISDGAVRFDRESGKPILTSDNFGVLIDSYPYSKFALVRRWYIRDGLTKQSLDTPNGFLANIRSMLEYNARIAQSMMPGVAEEQ